MKHKIKVKETDQTWSLVLALPSYTNGVRTVSLDPICKSASQFFLRQGLWRAVLGRSRWGNALHSLKSEFLRASSPKAPWGSSPLICLGLTGVRVFWEPHLRQSPFSRLLSLSFPIPMGLITNRSKTNLINRIQTLPPSTNLISGGPGVPTHTQ